MRYRRQTSPRWPRVVILLAAILGVAAFAGFALLRPELVTVSPASGAVDVSPHVRLRFTFSQPMAEAAITSEPENLGELNWNAEFTELTIKPREAWPREQTVTVRLNGGLSRLGLPLLGEQTWTFTVGAERLIYLDGVSNNLFIISLAENAQPRALTAEPLGVNEYTVHPNGESIVYSTRREDGGADLRLVEIETGVTQNFLPCPNTACRAPAFSPDGRRVAYERQLPTPTVDGSTDFGNARVFVFTPSSGADEPVGEIGNQTRMPRWAPDGRLSFYDTVRQAIVVRNINDGSVTFVPNDSGEMGAWSPDSQVIVLPQIIFLENALVLSPTEQITVSGSASVAGFYSHLQRVTVATNTAINLSGEAVVEDAAPVYSWNGDWLIFARRELNGVTWTPGRQLWRMRPDGSEARALTDEPLFAHSAVKWSPDDTQVAFMRLDATDPTVQPEIWLMNADGTHAHVWVKKAYLPEWLP